MRSFEPGQSWFWDYVDEKMITGLELAAPLSHPVDQASPGPADRLPADWRERVTAKHG